jgi:tetratricopeptide (TPR) repeat protein
MFARPHDSRRPEPCKVAAPGEHPKLNLPHLKRLMLVRYENLRSAASSLRPATRVLVFLALLGLQPWADARAASVPAAPHRTQGGAAPDEQKSALEAGKPLERELSGGGKAAFQVRLEAGQFLHVAAEQLEINVRLTLFDPSGARIAEANYAHGTIGREDLYHVAQATGLYELRVGAEYDAAPAGKFKVWVEELRPTGDADRKREAAERQLMAATDLGEQTNDPASPKTAEMYEEAARLFREVGDSAREATGLGDSGWLYAWAGQPQHGFENLDRALAIYRALGDRSQEGYVLTNMGTAYRVQGNVRKGR